MSSKKRVFVVEDDRCNLQVLRALIRSVNPDVTIDTDDSAEHAIKTLEREQKAGRSYDLIIADIFLAGKDTGLDLWKTCLERFRDVPVVVTSSMSLFQYFNVIGREDHAPTYLSKPYELKNCHFVLEELLLSSSRP